MRNEIWKDIVGYEGLYQISNVGRVKTLTRVVKRNTGTRVIPEYITMGCRGGTGYIKVALSKKSITRFFSIHRLIAIHFIPNPEDKPQVNHINGVKTDNRIENLEWCNTSENAIHSIYVLGNTMPKGIMDKRSKGVIQVSLDGFIQNVFESINQAAKASGIRSLSIWGCLKGKQKRAGGYRWYYECETHGLT